MFTLEAAEYALDDNPTHLWCLGSCHTITQVNGRSFYFYAQGHTGRRLRVEWRQWLAELQRLHWVWLLESDTCRKGWQLLRPPQLDPLAAVLTDDLGGLDRLERDQRFQRAVQQVLGRYRLERREDEAGVVCIRVEGGAEPYEVTLRLDWSHPPACSCPDAIHRRPVHGGFCKHTVAVLLRWPDLRCQLLTAIL